MPFIGNQPALSYTSFAKQDFTTSATTSYTLDNPVTNENEIALFINFVRQEPTTAYTASGTSLTLTSATSASDDMYCVFLGKAVQTVNPPNGSVGISQLSATGTKDATTFLRGDNTFASAGGANTPAFMAKPSGNISISNNTVTKLLFATEDFDTDSDYASSTFTPTTAGKYQVSGAVQWNTDTNWDALYQGRLFVYKNGSQIFRNDVDPRVSTGDVPISLYNYINVAVDMNGSSDYLELYGYVNVDIGNGALSNFWQTNSYFTAFRIIT
jgi:hypothetical protein